MNPHFPTNRLGMEAIIIMTELGRAIAVDALFPYTIRKGQVLPIEINGEQLASLRMLCHLLDCGVVKPECVSLNARKAPLRPPKIRFHGSPEKWGRRLKQNNKRRKVGL